MEGEMMDRSSEGSSYNNSGNILNEAFYLRGQGNGKEFKMSWSNKGKQSLVREGFMYRLDHRGKNRMSWRCCTRGCPASVKTDLALENILEDNDRPHSHPAEPEKIDRQLLRSFCKQKALEDCNTSASDIISSEINKLDGMNLALKSTKFLQLAMYRERKKAFPKMTRTLRSDRKHSASRVESGYDINNMQHSITSIPPPHPQSASTSFYQQATPYDSQFTLLDHQQAPDFNQVHQHLDHQQQLLQQRHQHEHHLSEHRQPTAHTDDAIGEEAMPQLSFHDKLVLDPLIVASTSAHEDEGVQPCSSNFSAQKKLCYADIRIHEDMLNDKVRTLAYRRALQENRVRLKGATVLDVGAGTGILSHFAVQAGANKVYAVESSSIAVYADKIAKENNVGSTITVIQSKIENAELPVKVDAIISEWMVRVVEKNEGVHLMGYCLLYESMLSSVLVARDRFLKPGGQIFPSSATLFLAPINDDGFQERLKGWRQMKSMYGVSMESLIPLTRDALSARADSRHLPVESVLANAVQLCHFDLENMKAEEALQVKVSAKVQEILSGSGGIPDDVKKRKLSVSARPMELEFITTAVAGSDFSFKCYGQSMMHGFATWFSVNFPGSVTIDTSPYALKTHWGQTVMYVKSPVTVRQDSEIKGVYTMHPSAENQRIWNINIDYQVNRSRKISQQWQCAE